ncbi:MAG: hypothetical protein Q7J27_02030 [Syntrophales bacterium]|nr:hypothetical protein [Syntrophales bacterium]
METKKARSERMKAWHAKKRLEKENLLKEAPGEVVEEAVEEVLEEAPQGLPQELPIVLSGFTPEKVEETKAAREKGFAQWQEKKELKKEGMEWPLPKLYSTVFVADINTRQKTHKLTWNLEGKQESMIVRQNKLAKASFLVAIKVLRSLGYREDLKLKEELSPAGWYFKL